VWNLVPRTKEEHRLRVFENSVLKRLFGPKRREVAWGLRWLCNEELHNLYASLNIVSVSKLRRMIWAGHVARLVEIRNAYKIMVGIHEDLGRPRHRCEDNIRMSVRKTMWGRCRLYVSGCYKHGNEPSGSVKGRKTRAWVTVSFSSRTLLHGVNYRRFPLT
jgi:hypothetical protein